MPSLNVGDRVVHVNPAMRRSYPAGVVAPDPCGCDRGLVSVRPDDGSGMWVLPGDQVEHEDDAQPRT